MTFLRFTFLVALGVFAWGDLAAQEFDDHFQRPLITPEAEPPTAQVVPDSATDSGQTRRSSFLFDLEKAAARSRPRVHPYFRNELSVMKDLRRLLRFVAGRGVHGYESVRDLVDIARELPIEKQTEIAGTALVGGVANILAGLTNKELRRRRIRFFRWDADRVMLRSGLGRLLTIRMYKGLEEQGVQVYSPRYGIVYSHRATEYYTLRGVTYWLSHHLAVDYSAGDGRQHFSGMIVPGRDYLVRISYRRKSRYFLAQCEVRKLRRVNLRFTYVKFLDPRRSHLLRSEMLVRL